MAVREEVKECKVHGMTIFGEYKNGNRMRWKCKKCQVDATQKRREKVKQLALEYKGNKCSICGYDKCAGALEFHHLDMNEKEFGISAKGYTRSWEKVKKELDKCILVCANCHRELHNPGLSYDNILNLLKDVDKLSFTSVSGSICPVCKTRFKKNKGKIYCSSKCREKDKGYPPIEDILEQYELLGNWQKVADHFELTRKIIQGIRKRSS